MSASEWSPLKSDGLMSCVCLGFGILHVKYLMDVQVVVLMVPLILELDFTWVVA